MNLDFTHRTGNTFEAVPFEIKKNNVAINLTGATIVMTFKKEQGGASVKTFAIGTGITVTSAIAGQFKIDKQTLTLPPFNYFYDIVFTFSDGSIKTYISGNFLINY